MRRTKRLGALLIAMIMVFTMIPFTTAGAVSQSGEIVLVMNNTEFTVNGTKTKIDAQGSKPLQEKGYTMLPLRAILEATGGTLTYDDSSKKITIVRGGDTVVLTLGSKTAVVNGANRTLGAAPYAKNSRTLVHIRTLELFGMKVDWDSKTNNVTVKYVEPSKIFNLTLRNGMGTAYKSVQIAPAGAGEAEWSGNLLGADTLNVNQNITVQAPVTGTTGMYQLRCGYTSTNNQMAYHTINNINLTGMTDKADILMNSTTSPNVALDGVSITTRNIQLFIVNNSGKTMSALYYRKTGEQYYNQTNLLGTQMLSSGGTATAVFPYDSAAVGYDFYATCSPSGTESYTGVKLGVGTSSQTFATLTLGANGKIASSNSSGNTTTNTGDTEITFRNNSGSKIYELRASTSSGSTAIKNGTVVWSDSDGVKNGSTVTFKMDLRDTYRWYYGAFTSTKSSASPAYTGSVNYRTSGVTSARLTLSAEDDGYELMDADIDDCDGCRRDDDIITNRDARDYHEDLEEEYGSTLTEKEYDRLDSDEQRHYDSAQSDATFEVSQVKTDGSKSDNKSDNDGDVDLNLLSSSGTVKAFYVIDKSDYNDSSLDDDDLEDDYKDLLDGKLNEGSAVLIEDALEAGEYNYLAWVIGSKVYKARISVDDDADWASVVLQDKNSVECYDSEDNKVLVLLENDDAGNATIKMSRSSSSSSNKNPTVKDDSFAYVWLDIGSSRSSSEWTFTSSNVRRDLTEDLSDYDGFVRIKFDDDDFTAYDIDD